MEYVLLIVIIILLIVQNSKYRKESQNLNNKLHTLNDKLNRLLSHYRDGAKPVEKKDTVVEPEIVQPPEVIIEEPIPVERPTIPLVVEEEETAASIEVAESAQSAYTSAPVIEEEKEVIPPRPGIWARFKERNPDLEKFIGENLINKIGILILVLGISYFVKYAIDKDWINEPARVGIGILAGSLVLFIAHRLRQKYAPFSSVLVAGAIAIFYFTIAIAFHEYQLFGQQVAFAIMVLITAFSCLISLSYNRMELAILSLIGGFLVPFMISTDSGNYIVLFTYIAILDIGILALAYFKRWHVVQVLAFVFTMLLFGSWVVNEMNVPEPHYLGALIFAFVFYLIFIVITIINNLRNKGSFTKIQLVMLTLNNFVFYGIGILVLSEYKPEFKGLFTALLAVLNLGYALLLYKKFGLDKTAIYLLIGLTLTFITLAIPVQFSGNNITIFWAAEAVLLLWLSQKSQIKSYRFAAVVVQFLMLGSLLMDWPRYMDSNDQLSLVLNPVFIGGLFVVASFVAVGYLLRHETEKLSKFGLTFNPQSYRKFANILAIITGYFVGMFEVGHQSYSRYVFNDFLAIILLYHLLFVSVFCFILERTKNAVSKKLVNILVIVNIVLFAFLFMRIPFLEIQDNIRYSSASYLVYYLHLVSLILIVYLWYLLLKSNKGKKGFSVFNRTWTLWAAIFVIVVTASTEVIIQGLHFMDASIDNTRFDYDAKTEMISAAKYKIIKTGLPVLWGVMAFILLIIGIKKQIKHLRIIALTLLGITIVKLFVYDISNVSETGKIIAFILLGVLILIISFVYQKLKFLVVDEHNTPENDKID
ncbi:DUF2339 domain-containing protein [Gelidibacter pelagius]|uniref:DUF2339 domain-containing protein n=1 Tax=Gelidibacter pelagius TaxID=2819985 RepID=A0ABS3SR29_9FLAO|nr:DUF2339 domain-containing protein [Gelidibacter pelagius]MBO3098163.1 DUF2339 domain-containing protein [Gelidibacter pelagius]